MKNGKVRKFETGATRDTDQGKLDYEGFLSPAVLRRYAEYLNKHRIQSDGKLRDSDNWQQGIPKDAYMKSMFRHFMDVWAEHRHAYESENGLEDALCALMFNAMGYLFELLKEDKELEDITVITYMKTFCSTCPKKNYSDCQECRHYKDLQELLNEIENDGGDKYEQ